MSTATPEQLERANHTADAIESGDVDAVRHALAAHPYAASRLRQFHTALAGDCIMTADVARQERLAERDDDAEEDGLTWDNDHDGHG